MIGGTPAFSFRRGGQRGGCEASVPRLWRLCAYEQGLSERRVAVDELFAEETSDAFVE